jgi:LacI family repressor for deo operon, udp, cdd, tsx, nupC, and nupG
MKMKRSKSRTESLRPATIRDVANELGMSVATVSRALSRPQMLRPATREKVREAVERLSYRPNLLAKNLKLGSSSIVYVVVPSLSPFFLEIFRGIESAAQELGYSAVMGYTNRDPVREGEFFDQVACGRADGLLLVSSARAETPPPHKFRLPPIVAVLEAAENENFPTVRVDHIAAGMQATEHLIALGHRNIAHITGNARAPMAVHRRAGYLAALAAAGIRKGEESCVPGEFTVEGGEAAMRILLARPKLPTAVFAANDEIAVGAIRAARAAGLHVPDDISIIGFDDQRLAAIYDPALTTVRVPAFDLGFQAMVKMRRILAQESYEHDVVLPTHIVQRATTAPPRKKH